VTIRTRWLSAVAALVVGLAAVSAVPVAAQAAQARSGDHGGRTITVGASRSGSGGGGPGGATGGGGAGQAQNPWLCVDTKLVLNDEGGFAAGGPTPGSWYSVTCINQVTGASTTATEWIPDQAAASTPAVNPYVLALQAENSLRLPSPTVHFNPADFSVVNLATWLWIGRGIWHPYAVTATVGTVSATAVAKPESVTWVMGDGGVETCGGPGTPFDPAGPPNQSTNCLHTYSTSSMGQSSPDGNPNDGAYPVVATVQWSVTWSAVGAQGGGALPPLSTSTSTSVRVEQVQSVNSEVQSDG
jgi:hypothetical protein